MNQIIKKSLGAMGLVMFAGMASAALPPLFQSKKEIKSLLDDERIDDLFGSGRAIQSIVRTDKGYRLSSNNCSVEVEIKYLPPPAESLAGPALFEFVVPDQLNCP